MARYGVAHKADTHQRILDAAGRLFRTEGFGATGVAKVMAAVDLTVGGFYAHFAGKEALLAEVLTQSVAPTKSLLFAGLDELEGEDFVRELMRRYLSRLHRDMPAEGCALPSLTVEVARQSDDTKQVFQDYLEALMKPVQDKLPKDRAIALV